MHTSDRKSMRDRQCVIEVSGSLLSSVRRESSYLTFTIAGVLD